MSNRKNLQQLAESDRLKGNFAELLNREPAISTMPIDSDRIRGMLLGLAIGDSLGNTSESMNPERRLAKLGEITDYRPNRHANGRRVGLPSDDTQMAFWTLEHLLEHGHIVPEVLVSAAEDDESSSA